MTGSTNVVLAGFMGTGKTTVGRLVANRLGRTFLDTDAEIVRKAEMSIPELFERYGEGHFRALEEAWCQDLGTMSDVVVATGGGMPVPPAVRKMLVSSGIPVCLRSSLPQVRSRIGRAQGRPMLEGDDLSFRIGSLLVERNPAYSSFPFQIDTTDLTAEEVTERILAIADRNWRDMRCLSVNGADGGGYTIVLGGGALGLVGEVLRDRGITSRVAVVTDTCVGPLYADRVIAALEAAGFKPFSCTIPAGEQSKTLVHVQRLYERFVAGGLDRRGGVVALGGGVVGDLAGFAAATYMRGVALVQCPTTLLAMVDSSVGGKTGVDLEQGKNLVGAFKQPVAVVADTETLQSLPPSQIGIGMAELMKHAIIADADLFRTMERSSEPARLTPDLIRRSVEVKIRVVEADPFESGLREVLNLGHTVGHAIERCTEYGTAHGDAVSIGVVAAAAISQRVGLCEGDVATRVERVFRRAGLPVRHSLEPSNLVEAMASDKKSVEGRVRFTLIRDIGVVQHGCTVDPVVVTEVLESLKE